VVRRILLAGLLLLGEIAFASPVTISLISFDGPFVNGIPTYPYTLQIAGGVPFFGMCDDYYHDGAPGDIWQANITNLGTGNLTYARFASAGLAAYQEAGWILIQTTSTPSSQWPDMNFAVWNIFNPTVPITSQAQNWIDLAILNHSSIAYNQVYIATPVQINAPPSGDQEFLFHWTYPFPPVPTPEPGSIALLTTGALAAFATLRRRLNR